MTEPRIAPIEPPYAPEVQAEFDKLMRGAPPLLLFRTVARNPRVLQRMMDGSLLDRGSISLGSAADECWSVEERLIIRLADQLHDTDRVDDALWAQLSEQFAA